ncbi:DNA repair protein XRCC1-like isoform X2 [Mercenaria mercenaria]|uniref:DNA repair protein XRCC1-like isoform X2 n=1 Tax=Mercenaria mercenaria TaxID=6596 RepID=UPI00234F63EE|nr:DNA repair protein XRCC1-like isoform X2 [Mercenaria mercenaria]
MPEIKVQHIVSFSSEDKNHPADNLLKPEGTHKWKCAASGEKSISVVIQFEKASQIQSVDIGNEGSAFVEILVGRSSAATDHDYQVLLVASSFMTPLEARNGTNRNSVRMFDASKLSATVSSQKWDRVKIVCTQPFNKTSTFGLSFIKFHGPSAPGEKGSGEGEKKMGFFKLKADDKDDVKTGSLFSHRKPETSTPSTPLSGAAAARAASRLAEQSKPCTASPSSSSSTPAKQSPKIALEPAAKGEEKGAEKKVPTPSQNREKRKHNVSDDEDTEDGANLKPALRKQSTSLSSVASRDSAKSSKPPPLKKTRSEPPKESPVKEFSRLMEKVVFVMSGYQNPYRAELRDRAVAMGATYRPDWGKGCTHLICAFQNTPKYNQVKGRGRIVDKKWINDCYKQKKLLPWRDYRLGDADSPDEDSDEEVLPSKSRTEKPKQKTPKKEEKIPVVDVADSDEDMYGGDTDSGEDTEDEIRKIKEGKKKKISPKKSPNKESPKKVAGDDPYDVDTDEDEKPGPSKAGGGDVDSDGDSGLPELPDFFADKHFFLYGEMAAAQRRLMTRFITAYAGELEDYMSDKVKYVVTAAKWDKNFDDALSDNPNLVFVKPKWVQTCHEKLKCVPHQPYIVVPPED